MIDYLFAHDKEFGIDINEICVFPLCRAVKNTINCVLKYPQIRKLVLYYGKISENTKFLIALGNLDRMFPASITAVEFYRKMGYRYKDVICQIDEEE